MRPPRVLRTDMDEYGKNAVAKLKKEFEGILHRVTSPYLTNEALTQEEEERHFAASCSSHVATLFFPV